MNLSKQELLLILHQLITEYGKDNVCSIDASEITRKSKQGCESLRFKLIAEDRLDISFATKHTVH